MLLRTKQLYFRPKSKKTKKVATKETHSFNSHPNKQQIHPKMGKLHFTTLNYALYYTLHPKLSDSTLCTLNYHTYFALHRGVIFAVTFNRIMLHVISTCFLLRWNKVERLKYPSSSFPHSFSDFCLWSENMNRKIKEN